MKTIKILKVFLIIAITCFPVLGFSAEDADEHEGEDEAGVVELKKNSELLFKVTTTDLKLSDIANSITSPGEVVLNQYKTALVSLRIDGQIIKRLAKMGEEVETGQALAVISSIQMSEAQQAYIVNVKEWRRVKQLGKQVVSGKRFIEARSKWHSSEARLVALGLDKKQLSELEKNQNPDGIFRLNSPINGIVISDDFIEGEYAAAGSQLFVVSDESVIWVEASVSPDQASLFTKGDFAEVVHSGESHSGVVSQISHIVSESTRTLKIRIEIDNSKDDLHPGQFVTVKLRQAASVKKMAVPESALVRTADGDWGVFVEFKKYHYRQIEVEVLEQQQNLAIINGLTLGMKVVTDGAFYLSAELAKAGFDPHGH
jgi:RND family efflux transporter MFP subunit